jgi:hypothetical protein
MSAIRFSCALCGLLAIACRRDAQAPAFELTASVSPDRLTASESLPSVQKVFGAEVPRGLQLAADFGDRVLLEGPLAMPETIGALNEQFEVGSAEATPERVTLANARPKHGNPSHTYMIEISRRRQTTRVEIIDVTPPPVSQGLTEEQRWEQAGRRPDGTPLDLRQVY